MKKRNNQFLFASTVIDNDGALAEPLISNITSALNYNHKGNPLFYSSFTPGAYELTEKAELIKEETEAIVIIEHDMNTMKCIMEIK